VAIAWFAGARFDIAFGHVWTTLTGGGLFDNLSNEGVQKALTPDHGEL
jgi:hypothetical protein